MYYQIMISDDWNKYYSYLQIEKIINPQHTPCYTQNLKLKLSD